MNVHPTVWQQECQEDLEMVTELYSKYRVIHKFLQDFRPLRYSSRDGQAEGEDVNRGRVHK